MHESRVSNARRLGARRMKPLHWLLPWEFSPSVMVCCTAAVILFARGSRRESGCAATSRWRQVSFYLGITLIYVPLQTGFDYFAQHMFWIHRLQHLLLHHIAPFLVALSAPWSSMSRGLPVTWQDPVITVMRSAPIRGLYGILQQPLIAFTLFVGLIYFWLWPSVHFRAMLSADEYKWMNWSMALDGLLFWWLILDPRSREEGARIGFGTRVPFALFAMLPQLLIGAYLTFHATIIYDVYTVCGRLWPVDPISDQQIGGLITWIPACMMSVVGALISLRRWMYDDTRARAARTSAGIDAVLTASQLR
jgi:putative membrane protein